MEHDSELEMLPLSFLHLTGNLKHLPRTGWLRAIESPESVAAHMYRLSLLAILAPEAGLDKARCILLALCHDIPESVAGDIPTYASIAEHKSKLEDAGSRYIHSLLNSCNPAAGTEIRTAWLEYEEGKTPEAKFMREMDKFECLLQACEYEQSTFGEKDLEEFQGLSSKIVSPIGKAWVRRLEQERQENFAKRRRPINVIFVIGAPGTGKKTQSVRLCQEFDFEYVCLDDISREKSHDRTYPHAPVVRHCIENKIDLSKDLKIKLLEKKIEEGIQRERKWFLVHGFPRCVQELTEFEEKVQRTNSALHLKCSPGRLLERTRDPARQAGDKLHNTETLQNFYIQSTTVEDHFKAAEGYFSEVNADGSSEETYEGAKKAIREFLEYVARQA